MPEVFNEFDVGEVEDEKTAKAKFANLKEFSDITKIGEGNSGITFKAKWNGTVVALKAFKTDASEDVFTELVNYTKIPRHPNVIRILGLCTDFSHELFAGVSAVAIIMPFYAHGDLMAYIGADHLSLKELANIALGMARGIAHLHKHKLIHRDVRPENFLVDEHRKIVVSDFGLSRSVSEQPVYESNGSKVPWRWCAPESIIDLKYTKESDIWMLGVSYWQLFHKECPFLSYKTPAKLGIAFGLGLSLTFDDTCPSFFSSIIGKCTKICPGKRISLEDIIETLLVVVPDTEDAQPMYIFNKCEAEHKEEDTTAKKKTSVFPKKATYSTIAPKVFHQHKCAIIGSSAIGKTSLMHRFNRNRFFDYTEPTIGAAFVTQKVVINNEVVKFELWDTAGNERYYSNTPMYTRGASVVVIAYDITDRYSFNIIESKLLGLIKSAAAVIVIVGCKCDLECRRCVTKSELAALSEKLGAKYYCETSSKTGEGVSLLFAQIGVIVLQNFEPGHMYGPEGIILVGEPETRGRGKCCNG